MNRIQVKVIVKGQTLNVECKGDYQDKQQINRVRGRLSYTTGVHLPENEN